MGSRAHSHSRSQMHMVLWMLSGSDIKGCWVRTLCDGQEQLLASTQCVSLSHQERQTELVTEKRLGTDT